MNQANHIDRIQVTGFKSFETLDLTLAPINILVGGNGAGKTNFIKLFYLLSEMAAGRFQTAVGDLGDSAQILYGGPKRTETINVRIQFTNSIYQCTWKFGPDDRLFFSSELSEYGSAQHRCVEGPYAGADKSESRLFADSLKVHSPNPTWHSMRQWCVYHFHDTSDSSRIKAHCDLHDDETLAPDARNLAAFLYRLANSPDLVDTQFYQRICKTIQLVAPFFDEFVLKPNKKEKILLRWHDRSSDQIFGPSALSDGTLRFICLATLLLQPNPPATILIDEPELGLHPYAINVLAGLIRSASHRSQVIVTTQSVPLVNQFEFKDLIVIDRQDGPSVARRLSETEITGWLTEYEGLGLGDLWEKNLIGGRP